MKRLLYLDSLRGLAALSISLFWHYQHFCDIFQPGGWPIGTAPWWMGVRVFVWTQYAVDFFFILSGIVFSHVYWERVRQGRVSGKQYAWRRFARLYPIHVATLVFVAGLSWWFRWRTGHGIIWQDAGVDSGVSFVRNLLFLQGIYFAGFNLPSWSLSIEELMYTAFFWLARWGVGAWAFALMMALGAASTLCWSAELGRGLMGFGFGVLLYRYAPRMAVPRWLESRPLVRLGDLSLTIYMIHIPIQMAIIVWFWWLDRAIPYNTWAFWLTYALMVVSGAAIVRDWYVEPMREGILAYATR